MTISSFEEPSSITNAYVEEASVVPSLSVAEVSVKDVAVELIAEASVVSKNATTTGTASLAPRFVTGCGTNKEPSATPRATNGARIVDRIPIVIVYLNKLLIVRFIDISKGPLPTSL
jgi:hypothetical protein